MFGVQFHLPEWEMVPSINRRLGRAKFIERTTPYHSSSDIPSMEGNENGGQGNTNT
jgi:hypothetical protein